MIPRLVPEVSPLDAFCDRRIVVVGIGDSRSLMVDTFREGWQARVDHGKLSREDCLLVDSQSPTNLTQTPTLMMR